MTSLSELIHVSNGLFVLDGITLYIDIHNRINHKSLPGSSYSPFQLQYGFVKDLGSLVLERTVYTKQDWAPSQHDAMETLTIYWLESGRSSIDSLA